MYLIFFFFMSSAVASDQPSPLASCSNNFSKFIKEWCIPLPIPQFARNHLVQNDIRVVLENYKAGSKVARGHAAAVGREQLLAMGFNSSDLSPLIYGTEIEIRPDMLPKPSRISIGQTALTHPAMKRYIEELNRNEYRLLVDPTLLVESDYKVTMGLQVPTEKVIRIAPRVGWEIFLHEYEHFMQSKYQTYVLPSMLERTPELVSKEMWASLPADQREMYEGFIRYLKKGYGFSETKEFFATRVEINTLEKMGYSPWSHPVYEAREYAWGLRRKQLERLATARKLSFAEKAEWGTLYAKRIVLHPEAIRIMLGGAAIKSMYYNEGTQKLVVETQDKEQHFFQLKKEKVEDGSRKKKTAQRMKKKSIESSDSN